jgi:hypothetical protein
MNFASVTRRSLQGCKNLLSRLEDQVVDQKWIFVHLPKCGGTSISSALQQALAAGPEGFVDPVETREWARYDLPDDERAEGSDRLFWTRLTLLRAHVRRGVPFVYGHFPVDERLFADRENGYRWLTVLRDPVDRLLSQFKYWTLTREPSAADSASSIDRRWEAYLDSDLCRYHANLYGYFLGGHAAGFDGNRVDEMQERAKANLQAFDVCGCIENLPTVADAFQKQSGRPVHFRRLNSSKAHSDTRRQMQVLEEFEKRVDRSDLRDLTRGDAEIYQLVRN